MSAPSCINFVGLRFPITNEEVEALEERRDARQIEARNAGLKTYWGNFGVESPQYALFIGTQLGSLGPEDQSSLSITADELAGIAERTSSQLASTTMRGAVGLHIEFHPD